MDDFTQRPAQSSYGESTGMGVTGRVRVQVSEQAADIKYKIHNFGRKATGKINESRESAAGALDQTASSIHLARDTASSMVHTAGDKIQVMADYVRLTDLNGMAEDVPGKALPGSVAGCGCDSRFLGGTRTAT